MLGFHRSHRRESSNRCWHWWAVGIGATWGHPRAHRLRTLLPPFPQWSEAVCLKVSVNKSGSIKIHTIRFAFSYLGASGGVLGLPGGIGLLPLCRWKPWAVENDASSWGHPRAHRPYRPPASRVWRHCKYASSWVHPWAHWPHGLLPFLGWRLWADANNDDQACKLPVASASCPDENQAHELLGGILWLIGCIGFAPSVVGAFGPMEAMTFLKINHVVR